MTAIRIGTGDTTDTAGEDAKRHAVNGGDRARFSDWMTPFYAFAAGRAFFMPSLNFSRFVARQI
jgi:hypothetical protein